MLYREHDQLMQWLAVSMILTITLKIYKMGQKVVALMGINVWTGL